MAPTTPKLTPMEAAKAETLLRRIAHLEYGSMELNRRAQELRAERNAFLAARGA